MKIIRERKLSDVEISLQLEEHPNFKDEIKFRVWARETGIIKYVRIDTFYEAEMFGDLDYPAIILEPGAPEKIKMLCILKWS